MREDEAGRQDAEREQEAAGPAAPAGVSRAPAPVHDGGDREAARRDPASIRAEDTEPYVGLQYVARLFKIVAMIVIVAIVAEVVAGLGFEASSDRPAWPELMLSLLTEVIQGGVLAAMLWGAGDLTLLFIDVGHDVRASRVLLGRLSARADSNAAGGGVRREPRGGEGTAADRGRPL
ncbi:MAG TPA: hypothetical protein VNP72_09830 [Longimicrobium sp.]|nr:hypothetical protein [Longimicrobium sp.]